MKQILLSALTLTCSMLLNSQQSLNQNDYDEFVQNQQIPLSKTDDELFLLDGISWIRLNGEKEYVLSPTVENISKYKKRIRKANQPEFGIYKSTMNFVSVQINSFSKTLLETMDIKVPEFVVGNVNVYLPLIDIECLITNGISVIILDNYGKHPIKDEAHTQIEKALIWSENWEVTALPSSAFTTYTGTVNCGWSDEDCWSHAGDWSVWCAGEGAACNACIEDYVNNMDADLANSTFINIGNYTNVVFSYWMDVDFNNTGTNDALKRWTNVGAGWVLNVTYTSASPEDGEEWVYKSSSLSGSPNQFKFSFDFESNSTGTSYGAYLDDLMLNGTSTASVYDLSLDGIQIYPNPANGHFSLVLNDSKKSINGIEILDITGKSVFSESNTSLNGQQKLEFDLSSLSSGIYSVVIYSENNKVTKQLIIE